jgi:hypothetical protein
MKVIQLMELHFLYLCFNILRNLLVLTEARATIPNHKSNNDNETNARHQKSRESQFIMEPFSLNGQFSALQNDDILSRCVP